MAVRFRPGAPQTHIMEKLTLETSNSLYLDIEAKESDPYTEAVCLEFTQTYKIGSPRVEKFFLSADQLELAAKYMQRKAEEIRWQQKHRLDLSKD